MVLRLEIGVLDRGEADGSSGLPWKGCIWTKKLIYCEKCCDFDGKPFKKL
jgi:hypothetical protein